LKKGEGGNSACTGHQTRRKKRPSSIRFLLYLLGRREKKRGGKKELFLTRRKEVWHVPRNTAEAGLGKREGSTNYIGPRPPGRVEILEGGRKRGGGTVLCLLSTAGAASPCEKDSKWKRAIVSLHPQPPEKKGKRDETEFRILFLKKGGGERLGGRCTPREGGKKGEEGFSAPSAKRATSDK